MTKRAPQALERAKQLVTPALQAAVASLPPEAREIAEYHLGWKDAAGQPTSGGGKALRPALALLSAEAAGVGAEVGIPGGVAIELVHNFSLLHDDVIDCDRERRHRPTVWSLWGVGQAVIVGDALLTLAFQVLFEAGNGWAGAAAARLCSETAAMIAGQVDDMAFERRSEVSVQECLDMEAKKTGALLSCACSLGAILAGAPAALVQALSDYGLHMGMAFQAVDDLLGIWGKPEVTGKPAGSDLRQRKKTLPVAAALGSGHPAAADLRALLSQEEMSEEQLTRAIELVEECGGRQVASRVSEEQLAAALAALDGAVMPPATREELSELARFVGERDY